MNGTYYPNPTFPTVDNSFENNYYNKQNEELSMEQSYIENILRLKVRVSIVKLSALNKSLAD